MLKAGSAFDIVCPLPVGDKQCGEPLHIMWRASRGLYVGDVAIPAPIDPTDAWVLDWSVECEAGHVLATPDDAGCRHPEEIAEQPDHLCDVDASDEFRTFRASDAARLYRTLQRINDAALRTAEAAGA